VFGLSLDDRQQAVPDRDCTAVVGQVDQHRVAVPLEQASSRLSVRQSVAPAGEFADALSIEGYLKILFRGMHVAAEGLPAASTAAHRSLLGQQCVSNRRAAPARAATAQRLRR
jgi:hypothetical protein